MSGFSVFINNATKEQKEDKTKYYPRVAGIKQGYKKIVKIEFSVPKLIFLNNLDELEEKDFDEVINTLHERLKEMNVYIEKKRLRVAEVSAIHFGKNIILKDGYTPSYVISELEKININKHFDVTKTRFMSDSVVCTKNYHWRRRNILQELDTIT